MEARKTRARTPPKNNQTKRKTKHLELRALTVSVEGFFVKKAFRNSGTKHLFFKGQIEF